MPKTYRTLVLKCEPDEETREALDTAFAQFQKFCEIGMGDFAQQLYSKYREDAQETEAELHVRVSNLVARRFANTVMKQEGLPFDKDCYKLVKKDGRWFLEVRVLRKYEGKKLKAGTSYLIPVCKTDNKYYGMLLENSAFPVSVFKEGEQYKAAVAIPMQVKFEANRPTVVIGINLTMWKHAATLYNPETGKFERDVFYDCRWLDEKAKDIHKKIDFHHKQAKLRDEDRSQTIRDLHGKVSEIVKKAHGEFITKLVEIAEEYCGEGYNVVFSLKNMKGFGKYINYNHPWLNYKLRSTVAWSKFANMLEPRGYYVVYTMFKKKVCHRCGEEGEVKKRRFECPHCGLKDFNADLNLARNIAVRGFERVKKRKFYRGRDGKKS